MTQSDFYLPECSSVEVEPFTAVQDGEKSKRDKVDIYLVENLL